MISTVTTGSTGGGPSGRCGRGGSSGSRSRPRRAGRSGAGWCGPSPPSRARESSLGSRCRTSCRCSRSRSSGDGAWRRGWSRRWSGGLRPGGTDGSSCTHRPSVVRSTHVSALRTATRCVGSCPVGLHVGPRPAARTLERGPHLAVRSTGVRAITERAMAFLRGRVRRTTLEARPRIGSVSPRRGGSGRGGRARAPRGRPPAPRTATRSRASFRGTAA